MLKFKADLHVHTVLSPCGDLEMSPANIVREAVNKKIEILGITDHNSTRHGMLVKKLAEKHGIFVLCGAEVTTREDIHCLSFFENFEALNAFQKYLEKHLKGVKNNPDIFGYQVVLDEFENVVEEINTLLISALDQSINQVMEKVHGLNGLFIPAHIDRPAYSLISQLGFVPAGFPADAMEISRNTSPGMMRSRFEALNAYTLLHNSDAHYPEQIGSSFSLFEMEEISFDEITMALKGAHGRSVITEGVSITPLPG